MRGQLSLEDRLQINVSRLKNNALRFRSTIKNLKEIIKEKDQKISELEEKLIDKEAQRKELQSSSVSFHLSRLWECSPRKQHSRRGNKPAGILAKNLRWY